jgi:catechol 2,3-dioxygenase-like lactoylglutathione lyase family enzyme
MRRIHHVNLGVHPDVMDDEVDFLIDVLGYRRADPPAEALRFGAQWFDADDGTQVHLSRDPDHRPAARAHTALVVGDELDDIKARSDPAGNRWELRST